MSQSTIENGPSRSITLGPELQDPSHELGFIKWHDFTAPADGQIPTHALTRTWNAMAGVNREFAEIVDRWMNFHPGEPLPENPKPIDPKPTEQPFMISKDTRGDSIIDLDGLYILLRLGKMEEARGGIGMGKRTVGLLTELVNIQIEGQANT